jgi:hypothetical protein
MRVFTASGTYTPPANLLCAIVECRGGGGGGGGAASTTTTGGGGGGGGGGGYSRAVLSAAQIGASQTVTIGNGGAPQAAGSATSFGTLCVANGGAAGQAFDGNTLAGLPGGGASTTGAVGTVVHPGSSGWPGTMAGTLAGPLNVFYGGRGGQADGGPLAPGTTVGGSLPGIAADPNTGAGGSGAVAIGVAGAVQLGGNGGSGICIVTEYIA